MASSFGEEFFSQFTPLVGTDGRPVRAEDGLLMFVRANDGECVRFHDSQIHMEELERYIHNDLLKKASDSVGADDPQLDIHDSNMVTESPHASATTVGMQQQQVQQHSSQQQQHLQVQLTGSRPQLQMLAPQTLQSLHSVLQIQVSQKEQQHHQNLVHNTVLQQSQEQQLQQLQQQQQQLQQQSSSASHDYMPHQPLQVQSVHQQLQQLHQHLQQQQQHLQQQHHHQQHHHQHQQHQNQQQQNHQHHTQQQDANPENSHTMVQSPGLQQHPNVEMSLPDTASSGHVENTTLPMDIPPTSSTVDKTIMPDVAATSTLISSAGDGSLVQQLTTVQSTLSNAYSTDGNAGGNKKSGAKSRRVTISSTSDQMSSDQVWNNGKRPEQKVRDKQATQALIEIVSRPDVQAKLTHKNTKKKTVWQEIGEEMRHLGFALENPGEKCSQKWRNIERSYKDYEISKQVPDMGAKKLPEFYAELHQLLKGKHTFSAEGEDVGPSNLQLMQTYVDMESSSDTQETSHGTTDTRTFSAVPSSSASGAKNIPGHSGTSSADVDMFPLTPVTPATPATPSSQLPSSTSHLSGAESSPDGLTSILSAVQGQKKDISRVESLLVSVRDLLEEQRRDRDLMRTESKQRFAELKSLIEQNQREKMKFMYDFLKTIQMGKEPKKKGVTKAKNVTSNK